MVWEFREQDNSVSGLFAGISEACVNQCGCVNVAGIRFGKDLWLDGAVCGSVWNAASVLTSLRCSSVCV